MYQEKEIPRLLKILLILTFIGSGLTLFSNSFIFILFQPIKAMLTAQGGGYTYSFMGTTMDLKPFFDLSPYFYLIQALLSGVSLLGAVLMWQLKKVGFHLYTIAQICMLIVPKLFIRGLPFPAMELLISFLFVFYYSRFIKIMN